MVQLLRYIIIISACLSVTACSNKKSPAIPYETVRDLAASTQDSAAAHWISEDTLLIAPEFGNGVVELLFAPNGIEAADQNWTILPLTSTTLSEAQKSLFPHLADFFAYRVALHRDEIVTHISSEIALIGLKRNTPDRFTRVQFAGLLDALFTSGADDADEVNDYGARITPEGTYFTLWAPTAKTVSVQIFDTDLNKTSTHLMQFDTMRGLWRSDILPARFGQFYQYEVNVYHPQTGKIENLIVSDPYSLGLSINSFYSQIVDLSDARSKPQGWDEQMVVALARPEQHIIYESHIGDFSLSDETVPLYHRGKYKAFTELSSNGMTHLAKLRLAGLNTIHLLPAFDLSTIDEDVSQQMTLHTSVGEACKKLPDAGFCITPNDPAQTLYALLESYDPMTGDAQAVIEAIDEVDDYNWGYDPFHYTAPEGSYATDAHGLARIIEFREMVHQLHAMGFRVVMDVVYNHTFAAGLDEKSVLDKIVPGYYQRLNTVTGAIETSTCCANTASEHVMMGKLMTDSLLVWAREYKIDGFRFDLMGHQPKDLMLKARDAVREIDPDTYFYGEGWNFGEVQNNARFIQATQHELAGTQIGTFTDRLRDAVRGGRYNSWQDTLRSSQGITNGLYVSPNEMNTDTDSELEAYKIAILQTELGLAANLKSFSLKNFQDETVSGVDVPYGNDSAAYAEDPADIVNYVSKHDNQTLWDHNQYRIAHTYDADMRARMQVLALSIPMYAQGVPFFHMGSDMLRSKSFLRDSYNSGPWFNAMDWTGQSNNYNVGLPPQQVDGENWDIITRVLNGNQGRDIVTSVQIQFASDVFQDMLKIRSSSPLFSLAEATEIKERVSFRNSGTEFQPGLIVMQIQDGDGSNGLADLDPQFTRLLVMFNHRASSQTYPLADADKFILHPVQAAGHDEVVKTSQITPSSITVPGWSVAVFVTPQ